MGFFQGTQNEFETDMVNEPSVFEPLKLYCIWNDKYILQTAASEHGLHCLVDPSFMGRLIRIIIVIPCEDILFFLFCLFCKQQIDNKYNYTHFKLIRCEIIEPNSTPW